MKRFLLGGIALIVAGSMIGGEPVQAYAHGGGGGFGGGGFHGGGGGGGFRGGGGGFRGGGWHGGGGRWRNVDGWRGGGWGGRGWGWGWGGGYPIWGWGGWGYPYGWGWGWGGYGLGLGLGMGAAMGAAAAASSYQAAPGIYNGNSGSGPEDDSVYDAELNSLLSDAPPQQQGAPVPPNGTGGQPAGAQGGLVPSAPMQKSHVCPKGQVYNDLTESCDRP
ncbi:hypothetical protein [Novacetimonas cocois]|uniref:hypothetical protein n=1 Tax=Novacetimonas cocois TaxID=1747507 RepID=UPI001980AA28|nr:hypothetical protein [Novacetimonas cocois]